MDWDDYFVELAMLVKEKSKDPSSKIGAVLVGEDNSIISTGFNGFPRGIDESIAARWERPLKYEFVSHAERNAIDNAARLGMRVKGSRLYLVGFGPPTAPCTECAKTIIQAGVSEVIGAPYKPARDDWMDSLNFSVRLLEEAGVKFREYKLS